MGRLNRFGSFWFGRELVIAGKLNYGLSSGVSACENPSFEVGRILNGLMKTL